MSRVRLHRWAVRVVHRLVVDLAAYSPASQEEMFSGFTMPDEAGQVKPDDVGAVVITPEPVNGAGALRTWNHKNILVVDR